MTQKKIIIYAIILAAGIAVAQAQEKKFNPLIDGKTGVTYRLDTAALVRQIQAELIKDVPVYFLVGSDKKQSSHALYYVKGWQKAGMNLDSRKIPLPEWVIIFAVMPREEKKK